MSCVIGKCVGVRGGICGRTRNLCCSFPYSAGHTSSHNVTHAARTRMLPITHKHTHTHICEHAHRPDMCIFFQLTKSHTLRSILPAHVHLARIPPFSLHLPPFFLFPPLDTLSRSRARSLSLLLLPFLLLSLASSRARDLSLSLSFFLFLSLSLSLPPSLLISLAPFLYLSLFLSSSYSLCISLSRARVLILSLACSLFRSCIFLF